MNLYDAIACRHSVRKYEMREVPGALLDKILSYFERTSRLSDSIAIEAEILCNTKNEAGVRGIFKVEAPYYLVCYSEAAEGSDRKAGYVMEQMVLYMTEKGLGTCFLGGAKPPVMTKNGKRAVILVAFGYTEERLHRDSLLAKRLPLRKLCIFREDISDQMRTILLAARLAPSALNLQPWRFMVMKDRIYVFAQKRPIMIPGETRMRDISMGVMLSHIMLAAEELWLQLDSVTEDYIVHSRTFRDCEYVITLKIS